MNLVNAAEKSECLLSNLSNYDFFNKIQNTEIDYSEQKKFFNQSIEESSEIKKRSFKNKI